MLNRKITINTYDMYFKNLIRYCIFSFIIGFFIGIFIVSFCSFHYLFEGGNVIIFSWYYYIFYGICFGIIFTLISFAYLNMVLDMFVIIQDNFNRYDNPFIVKEKTGLPDKIKTEMGD